MIISSLVKQCFIAVCLFAGHHFYFDGSIVIACLWVAGALCMTSIPVEKYKWSID